MTRLAISGGEPIFEEALDWQRLWPPVTPTAEKLLVDVYRSRDWSAFAQRENVFAGAFAAHHDAKHGIFMANGTVTLRCGLTACGIGPGDEVIVPALTWCATATAVHYAGATPVFADVDPHSFCISPGRIEEAITERTRAIIPVHLYGAFADMEAIMAIARTHGLRVIEDCAHMHGGRWAGRGAGSIGDIGSFSFQHSKTMSSAEGGICITNDDELAERIFRLSHIGYGPGQQQGRAIDGPPEGLVCYPFRATAFQSVLLEEQLAGLEERLIRYGESVQYLEDRLRQTTSLRFQSRPGRTERQGYWGWLSVFDAEEYQDVPIDRIRDAIHAEGLPITRTWDPVYRFVLFSLPNDSYRLADDCRVAEHAASRILWLLHPYLGISSEITEKIGNVFEKISSNFDEIRKYTVP